MVALDWDHGTSHLGGTSHLNFMGVRHTLAVGWSPHCSTQRRTNPLEVVASSPARPEWRWPAWRLAAHDSGPLAGWDLRRAV
jgi:hypothetical protein